MNLTLTSAYSVRRAGDWKTGSPVLGWLPGKLDVPGEVMGTERLNHPASRGGGSYASIENLGFNMLIG